MLGIFYLFTPFKYLQHILPPFIRYTGIRVIDEVLRTYRRFEVVTPYSLRPDKVRSRDNLKGVKSWQGNQHTRI